MSDIVTPTAPEFMRFGYVPNPAATKEFEAYLARFHPPRLMDAAPHLMSDGMTGDLMPYLSYYEVEVKSADGSIWKAKDVEPPYEGQTGNNCTGISTTHVCDALMFAEAAQGREGVKRTATEATYAFGLYKAGLRGDNGCYGSALAKAVHEIGVVSYEMIGGPQKETYDRLIQFAKNPKAVVDKYKDQAAQHQCEVVKISSYEETCAWLANGGAVIIASGVGFSDGWNGVGARNEKGIVPARGSWPHQMAVWGVIRSDGIESVVILQSWGKNTPPGPQPFKLPSFAFRCTLADFKKILADDDTWGIRKSPGFDPRPLPARWTNADWLTVA